MNSNHIKFLLLGLLTVFYNCITANATNNNLNDICIEIESMDISEQQPSTTRLINVSDCKNFENMIREIYNFNVFKNDRFEQMVEEIYTKGNKEIYRSKAYSNANIQNNKLVSDSEFALMLAERLTQSANKLNKYKSRYYAINCYKILMDLLYLIGKDQPEKDGYTMNIGAIKIHAITQKHITSNKEKEEELHNYCNRFIPFYNFILNNVYPKMFKKPIEVDTCLNLFEVLERKSNEITYIKSSLLPQVKYMIEIANKIERNIALLDANIDSFKICLNGILENIGIKNKSIGTKKENIEIADILNILNKTVNNRKDKIEIDLNICEELINKIKLQVNNIDGNKWSYIYNLAKTLPSLMKQINRSKNIIIESNFSFAHNLDYLTKLIEAEKLSDDDKYNEEVQNILEKIKSSNSDLMY